MQIRSGAPADVFMSANAVIPAELHAEGRIAKPIGFARNQLVVVVSTRNPAGVRSVHDLAKPGVKVDVAAPSVPVGAYTLRLLRKLALTKSVLANVVSQETDVRSVLAKVAVGQADAGFVYATDARAAPKDVTVIEVPDSGQPEIVLTIAIVASSSNKQAAHAFVRKVLSRQGQKTLRAHGFGTLPPRAGNPSLRHVLNAER
jgi:molybdate transport system substrate-binding protein